MLDNLPFPSSSATSAARSASFALIEDAVGARPPARRGDGGFRDDRRTPSRPASSPRNGTDTKSAVLSGGAEQIRGDKVPLTNCNWCVEPKKTVTHFGFAEMILLNDFEARRCRCPRLGPADIDPISSRHAVLIARVVLGPGTGLGAAALIHANGVWIPVPAKAGHVDSRPGHGARPCDLAEPGRGSNRTRQRQGPSSRAAASSGSIAVSPRPTAPSHG